MAFLAQKLISASGATEETDADFNITTSLMHFDGSNNGNNNTFLDSSDSGHTLTRNGNTTQGTFSPFSADEGKWSGSFDGTDDYLITSTSSGLALGTGDYTIECFVYFTGNSSTSGGIFAAGNPSSAVTVPAMALRDTTGLTIYTGAGQKITGNTGLFALNTWYHLAMVRASGVIRVYKDGSLVSWDDGSSTVSDTSDITTDQFVIGKYYSDSYTLDGMISNLRIVKGTAVYTSAFTAPSSPLTAVTNTKLLTCCSNRFRDKSTSAHTLTPSSTPKIQPFSPFAPSAEYDSAVNGGSGYFDGSGDYLRLPSSSDFDFSGNFTIEVWLYLDDVSTSRTVLGTCANIGGRGGIYFGTSSTNFIFFEYITNTTILTAPITRYQWNHVAAVRNGVSITMYINGTSVASTTFSNSFSGDSANGGIGGFYSNPGPYYFDGFMSDMRIVNGTAVYTSNFTPPTAPLTKVTNTKLLANFTNGQMIDSTTKNNFETVGSVYLTSTVKQFGTTSCDLYGSTGSRVASPPSSLYNILNAGKFTVEFWIYVDNYHAAYSDIVGVFNGISSGWLIYQNGTYIEAYINGVQLQVTRPSTSTWTHIALTRDGTTTRLFKDGTSGATSTSALGADQTAYGLVFGGDATGRNGIDARIDEFRLTLGKARYTSNFTVPTEAFANL
tara:strand:+ start:672 stop:2672 length:2001 start_codon:yes stop_codon:yes gene_type:complete